jgi:protein-S-isoprenylcysteine O-methyltransferase Ste14
MNTELIFRLAGAGIIAVFFIVFFGKMAAQKRQGLKTSLFRRGDKPKKVFAIELTLKILVFATIGAQIASLLFDIHADGLPLRIAGAAVGAVGVAIIGVAIRTMADSWRTEIPEDKRTELVTGGIFRWSRNPAFLGFDLMFAGLAAMFFNPVLAALTVLSIVFYHLQILQEEKFLRSVFGTPYSEYMARTRRYLGTKKVK